MNPCINCTHKGICKYEENVQQYIKSVNNKPFCGPANLIKVEFVCSSSCLGVNTRDFFTGYGSKEFSLEKKYIKVLDEIETQCTIEEGEKNGN